MSKPLCHKERFLKCFRVIYSCFIKIFVSLSPVEYSQAMKRVLTWVGIVLLTPIFLLLLLAALLYLPPVQNWAVKQVSTYASSQTGMDISVDYVRLAFPLDLSIEGVRIIDCHSSSTMACDTIADVEHVVVDVQLLPLFRQQVEIDELSLANVKLNTASFIDAARVKGTIGHLSLESHGIDISSESLKVNKAELFDACLDVSLNDSVPEDTAESQNNWKILVDNLDVRRTDVTVHMPGDTLQVQAYLGQAKVRDGSFDLGHGCYMVRSFDLAGGRICYDNHFEKPVKGLDYHHLSLTDLVLGIDSFSYLSPNLDMTIRTCSFKEKSGIQLSDLNGRLTMTDSNLKIPELTIRTPESHLTVNLDLDLNTFAEHNPGTMSTTLHASIGKQDLMRFMGDMPSAFHKKYPNYPLQIDGTLHGNMGYMTFTGLNIELRNAFHVNATGYVANLNQPKLLQADVQLKAKSYHLDFLTALMDKNLRQQVRIPYGISLQGHVRADAGNYQTNFVLHEGTGYVRVKGAFDMNRMAYRAQVNANAFPLQHFLPKMGLSPLTAMVDIDGQGTDFLSSKTRLNAKASIGRFRYQGYDLSGMRADARVSNGHAVADINSRHKLLDGRLTVDALLNTKDIRATIVADIRKADLYHLQLLHEPFEVGLCGQVDIATNGADYYKIQGTVSDVKVVNRDEIFYPEDISLDVLTRRDTTRAIVNCGDFNLRMSAHGGYEKLQKVADNLLAEVNRQIENRTIDQLRLRQQLPQMNLSLTSGKDNFMIRMVNRMGYGLKSLNLDMASSPTEGLNGTLSVDSLVAAGIQLDRIRFTIKSDQTHTFYEGQVQNDEKNPQYTFNALFDGGLNEQGTNFDLKLYDNKDKLGVSLGLAAIIEKEGIRMILSDKSPVLGYKTFTVNDDNYLFLSNDQRVSAKVVMTAEDGTGIQVYSNDDNTDALQDITFTLHQFDLEKVLSVVPYTPDISGIMNGDFHVVLTKEDLSVSTNLSVDKMVYEKNPMGDVATEFVYIPKPDGSHYVDGILIHNDEQVGTLKGTYRSEGEGYLDAKFNMERFPLSFVNGFIPDQLFGLKGYGEGNLTVQGPLNKPEVNGEILLQESSVFSVPYGINLRFADDPVRIVGSHLLFENFEIFANNNSPLNISGSLDFSDLEQMSMNIRMQAKNFLLIDAKENPRSEAYGKAFVNFFGMMNGPVNNLTMRGKLDVLGSTDMTYVLRDSPLTTDNQLDELVKFTDFKDTTMTVIERPELSGFNMDLTMDISKGAHIMAYLNAAHSNYIDLMGGGNLRMQYSPAENLRLTGRYTLANGEMKYSLPVIPLKTFMIQDGSYLEFTGDPMNPTLNITAIEKNKATVTGANGIGRSVNFDCGVIITKTLEDMGLEFTLDAPEDMTLHNELQAMSIEQRGKLAVTMLTTGMYIADGNTGGFSMNSALSSFLESEINHITGNALRTLDLSIGLDNSTDASGNMHTDYSFKFAKRFWNNRLKVSIGGKVSTGSEMSDQNNSFFDNVSLEYRLDDTANKYMTLFYENNVYDWLDGYTQKFGGGFIWRRTLQHFWDIFRFRNEEPSMIRVPKSAVKDSLRRDDVNNMENEKVNGKEK